MISIEDIHEALRNIIALASGLTVAQVILADQDHAPPTGLYATYKPIPVRAVGAPRKQREDVAAYDTTVYDWTDFEETTVSQMQFILSCNFFNVGAENAAWKVPNANYRNSVHEHLLLNGIGWQYCSEVRNLTSLDQAAMQPRFQIDIHIVIEGEVSETVLRAAGFALTITDENSNVLFNGAT